MTIDDSIKTATSGVALVGEIIKAAGDNPQTNGVRSCIDALVI